MAHFASPKPAVAQMGGKHNQNHKLVLETPTVMRSGEPHSEHDNKKTSNRTGRRGSGQSASDETANEEDDEDSSGDKDENQDDEDPAACAPSRGVGLGKGKRPVIRVEPSGDDDSQDDLEEISSRGAGLDSMSVVNPFLKRNKKRTFSNVSNSSVIFGEESDMLSEKSAFPRQKLARRLSNNSGKGLLVYQKDAVDEDITPSAHLLESLAEEEHKAIDIDDEDYSGVNLISDESDIEMEHIEQQEEEWLINDVQQSSALFSDARRLSLDSSASDNFQGLPMTDDFFTADEYPDVGFGQFFEPEGVSTSREPSVSRKYSDSSTKRVRFDDEVNMSDSASTSSSELDTSLWPDLFEKDSLPASVHYAIEHDHELDELHYASSGSEHSYWDFGEDDNDATMDDLDDDSSEAGSSGYESDLGDTTDDCASDFESPPPQPAQKKSVLRRPASAPGSKASSPKPYQRSARPSTTRKCVPPVRGVFIHGEQNEAIAVTSKTTKTVAFYRPRTNAPIRRNYTANSSATSTAQNSPRSMLRAEDSDMNDAFTSPFQSATDIMFSGIFGAAPNDDFVSLLGSVGPPEAFYPFVTVNQNGMVSLLSDDDTFGEEDTEYGQDLNLEEFMNFGPEGDDTDIEQEESTDVPATPATSTIVLPGSTPAQPSAADRTPTNRKRSTSDVLLEHFDRGVVTAFRNNQNHYHSLARLPHDPDLRASVSRPLRSGRTAEAVMSPLRKRSSLSKKSNRPAYAGVHKTTASAGATITRRRGPQVGTFS